MARITLHRLYLHTITASMIPFVLMLESGLLSFYDDAVQPVVLKEFCCSLEPAC
jgi:hypothetical protein